MKQSKANSSKLYQPYFNYLYNTNPKRNQWLFLWITQALEERPGARCDIRIQMIKIKLRKIREFGSLHAAAPQGRTSCNSRCTGQDNLPGACGVLTPQIVKAIP